VNLEAVIAGPVDGDLDYSPETMIDELGETRTKLVGQVGPELRAALLSSATVYVLPSDDESFGMSVAEAMAAGCAVVCSPFVGVASDAQSSGAAVIVNQDPALLAESIQGLLASPETRRELGVRARQYASENLTWPSIGDRLASYYAKAAGAVT
jgi:glycosyltransferase involved in cell wall biosynthesis